MFESRVTRPVLAFAVFAFLAASVGATEVTLNAPGVSKDFGEKLRRSSLSIATAAGEDVTPQDMLAAAQADYARLVGVLYAAGYFGGVITINVDGQEAANIPPLSTPKRIDRVTLDVRPGAPFFFSTARIAPLANGTTLPEGFAKGQQARGDLIGEAAAAGILRWREVGYAKAKVVSQEITADHKKHTLSADIGLAQGPWLRFGNLNIARQGRVRDKRIREIAGLPTGDVYSPDEVRKAATRLRRTGAFRSVVLEENESTGPSDTLDITADLTDAKRRRVGVGAELSSLEGLTLSGFWLHRNLLGGAERLRFDGEISGIGGDSGGIDYRLSTRFERPATFTPDTSLFLLAKLEELDDPDYRERNIQLGAGLSHIFSDKLTGEAGITYRYTEIDDDLGSRSIQHLIFPLRLTLDKRDNALDATKGFYIDLHTDPFIGLDESTTGARVYADTRVYRSFGANDGVTLAARAQLGSVAGASTADVPPDMLFFSGGAGTVRGQPYQSLAVELSGGRRVGGRSFMAFSGEVRADITDKLGLVVFADTGFVGQDAWATENGNWHSGAGIGARYTTGVGPIRVDVATPIDGSSGTDFELYIGIGQAF